MKFLFKKYKYLLLLALISLVAGCFYLSATSSQKLVILHTNDMHGRAEPFDKHLNLRSVGGLARISNYIKQVKRDNKNVLVLDAGDMIQGTLYFKIFNGIPNIKFMSKAGYDLAVLGNHEFDKGISILGQVIDAAEFPLLCANIKFIDNPGLNKKVKPYLIKNYGGLKIGIIGIVTDDLKTLTGVSKQIEVYDDITTTQKYVDIIKDKVDFIIVLSHVGFWEDVKIAKGVNDIDLIVGGHSHSLLGTPFIVKHKSGEQTYIVQAGEYGQQLGKIELNFNHKKLSSLDYSIIPINAKISADKQLQKEINTYSEQLKVITTTKVGKIKNKLVGRKELIRSRQTSAGVLVTSAIKHKYPEVDIVIQNSGGIKFHRNLPPGDFTLAQVYELYPFDNKIIIGKLTGKQLKSILETSARKLPLLSGAFLQSKGLEYSIDVKKDPQLVSDDNTKILKEGNRIYDIKINGKELKNDQSYKVAFNDFMHMGGDGYSQLKHAKVIKKTKNHVQDLIVDYIKANSPIVIDKPDKINIIN